MSNPIYQVEDIILLPINRVVCEKFIITKVIYDFHCSYYHYISAENYHKFMGTFVSETREFERIAGQLLQPYLPVFSCKYNILGESIS